MKARIARRRELELAEMLLLELEKSHAGRENRVLVAESTCRQAARVAKTCGA